MIRMARLIAAILPVVGLGALWLQSDRAYHTGTEWEVPIQGYDPRDYLRGHYVEFSYDWPYRDKGRRFDAPSGLCIEGTPPQITQVVEIAPREACVHPLRPAGDHVYGPSRLVQGRLYIGQERADALQRQLQNRDQRGIVTIRQREDGSFTPISIRFRPLTPAEKAERDAPQRQIGAPFDPSAPPPVMIQQ